MSPPATTRAFASGPWKRGVAYKKLPATALCVERAFVPLHGARTAGGLSAPAVMESSKFSQDKRSKPWFQKRAHFTFHIPTFSRAVGKSIPFMFVFLEPSWELLAALHPTLHSGARTEIMQKRGICMGGYGTRICHLAKSCSSCIIRSSHDPRTVTFMRIVFDANPADLVRPNKVHVLRNA